MRLLDSTVLLMLLAAGGFASANEIQQSVGKQGANQPDDVLVVQLLLNQIPADSGGPEDLLTPDGLNGPNTIAAIERFQKKHFGADQVDGRVDPEGRTLKRLRATVAAQTLDHRIVRIAQGERLFWRNGQRTELDPIVSTRLQTYWSAVGLTCTIDQVRDPQFQSEHPWSSAFVSWVMQQAGAGQQFELSAAHWRYVAAAKANRIAANDNPFKAFRPEEQPVESADIVVKRRGDSTATYDNIEAGHKTHGDIIVAINGDKAETIGGNVRNSVTTTMVPLDDAGKVKSEGAFAIVKTQPVGG